MPKPASPAAAAGVSRALQKAGLRKAIEISKGVETQGFYASPHKDHVRVEFVPSPWAEDEHKEKIIKAGITECEEALADTHYDVKRVVTNVIYLYGEVEAPVLEVRSERWER